MESICMYCESPIEVDYCCDGRECACLGMPIDPPLCNKDECYDKFIKDRELARELNRKKYPIK